MISDQKGLLTRSFRSSLVITKNLSIKDLQGTIILFSHPRGQAALGRKGIKCLGRPARDQWPTEPEPQGQLHLLPTRRECVYSTGVVCMRGGQGTS